MLSILIPVYNYNANPLVNRLRDQIVSMKQPIEIIVFNDASDEFIELESIGEDVDLKLINSDNNVGRSKARNLLADEAKYDNLLFIDVDSLPVSNDFIRNYLDNIEVNTIVCGGTAYSNEAPKDSSYFRWYFGTKKEVISAEKRRKKPFSSFMANNFLIPKETFLKFKFEERISKYGHEDSLFGLEAKKSGVDIIHIDNPVFHCGLESADVFLEKSIEAIKNLKHILKFAPEIEQSIKLLKVYRLLEKFRLTFLIPLFHYLLNRNFEQKIKSNKIRLYGFNLFKLNYLYKILRVS